MRRWLAAALGVFGLALVGLGLLLFLPSGVRGADVRVLFAPLAKAPAENAHSVRLAVRIPNGPSWERARRYWEEPAFLVTAESEGGPCWDPGEWAVAIRSRGRPIDWRIETRPMFPAQSRCKAQGALFRAAPGEEVEISARWMGGPSVVSAELAVVPYWPGHTKDRMVGAMLAEDLRKAGVVAASAGALIIALAGVWRLRLTRPTSRCPG